MTNEYLKLENRLVLLAWVNSLFGYDTNWNLLKDTQEVAEGFDGEGHSFMSHHLKGRGGKVKIGEADLERYDDNIKRHLDTMNRHRDEPIALRYFQYLAVLYVEVFLDWLFSRPGELLRELNRFVNERNAKKPPGDPPDPRFGETDLTKLALWMATGSGKTLILYFNYRQFLHYNREPLDNILLITPNERLTQQHLEEMRASGIPCERFSPETSGLYERDKGIVRAVEITKLVEEKKGGGVSVDVESFEGNNLIFVDEGHKGSGGEAWRRFRDRLGQTGFTFEYSATFGQALTAARNDELMNEYGKAIAFDYSYRYFYGDGYGKDFHILNLRDEKAEDHTDTLLLANLLSFYEQKKCYEEEGESLRPYNLDSPLWIYVGSRVNAVLTEGGRKRSDVLTVALFLHRFLENKRGWAVEGIGNLLSGERALQDSEGRDVFADKFQYLRSKIPTGSGQAGLTAEAIYADILNRVFHAPASGSLHLWNIRGSDGELGLKVSSADDYFGLIYIGDSGEFKKLVEESDTGIVAEEDALSESLFKQIDLPDSCINVLIGAKKFMEGWSSWRVSNMGLLNVGRGEGSEIIQLFGRGVRLKGRSFSLKRSSLNGNGAPPHLRLLETLNIFAVRANYMAQFREYLEREGVETEGHIELPIVIKPNEEFLRQGLLVPRIPKERSFADDCELLLEPDAAARVTVDLSMKVESLRSEGSGLSTTSLQSGVERTIPLESLELLVWEALYLHLLEYKEQKGFSNLLIRPDDLRRLLSQEDPRLYRLIAEESVVRPTSFAGVAILQEAALSILRKYMDKFCRVRRQRWESNHMVYGEVQKDDGNFQDYVVKLPRSEDRLIKAVKELIDEGSHLYEQDRTDLPAIHFDRHLYQPLLVEQGNRITLVPPGLRESERRFVEDLREYLRREVDGSLVGRPIFLLRNLTRGKGIGFFDNEGFYPDFILWIKEGKQQRVVFIEPHGMRQAKAYWNDDKVRLHEKLKRLSGEIERRGGLKHVALDSFIISKTPYQELRELYGNGTWDRPRFAQAHILFFEARDYVADLFTIA